MNRSKKITIVGAGNVGATIAYTLTLEGLAGEIVLVDINVPKAKGEAMDIYQGTSLAHHTVNIHYGEYADTKNSDIVVITSGAARKPGMTRLDLVNTNVKIINSIAKELVAQSPNAIYVVVSNPVDILTYAFIKSTGLPKNQVIGTGTLLDSSRFRASLSEYFGVSAKSVHGYVFGEHGDSSMIPWSLATIGGMPITTYKSRLDGESRNCSPEDKEKIEQNVRESGANVIKMKGATYYAIAMSVKKICECIIRDEKSVLSVSTLIDNEYCGISDVCISLPFIVGAKGIEGEIYPDITDEEKEKLIASADTLKKIIKDAGI